jgi:hypothetical protein
VDAFSYGRIVEHGGYATGGVLVGEHGPEIAWASAGGCVMPAAGLVSRSDTSLTLTAAGTVMFAEMFSLLIADGRVVLPTERDSDDGTAGVPAKV